MSGADSGDKGGENMGTWGPQKPGWGSPFRTSLLGFITVTSTNCPHYEVLTWPTCNKKH